MSIAADLSNVDIVDPSGRALAETGLRLDVSTVSGAEWDRTIATFDEVCQEQLYTFAVTRWPNVAQEPMLFSLDGEVVGGSLTMIQKLPLGIGNIAVSKWGPMLKQVDHPRANEIYRAMIAILMRDYAQERGMMLSILPRASLTPVNARYEYLMKQGFKRGSSLLFPDRYIVNLRQDDVALRKSFAQKWRYHLNKAQKASLSFEHGDAARFSEFHDLYQAMSDRKQFPDHSAYDTVESLMALEEALRPELFFVRHEGELVAGALIFKSGDRAVYLYGATNDRALPLRAGYFLHWEIIRWLRDNTRASWYDLGGTDGFQGLHQFKKGMVGDAGVIEPVPPVANYAANKWSYLLGTGAFAARDAVHDARRRFDAMRSNKARPTQSRTSDSEGN
ncbi:GNAT family N-acetyltransferase [Devosia rhodophyticola]|uniref:GNAT family N-acetyltransferase n=1 Tax=Devosia rhodophyticola TaxID=3026423 RepID=A0ABY7YVZ9_9HYPH|nr:GNAT family N-acetyltransferase [Devosia rhodophyticola]WDR05382.1 GNAT family N-acetyltransferase [Devosia rhodophyticola]